MKITDDDIYAYIGALKADIKYLKSEIDKVRNEIPNSVKKESLTILDLLIWGSLFSIFWVAILK